MGELRQPAVVVLVGPPASGKTMLRRRLVDAGLPGELVVSLDDLRREIAAEVAAAGGPVRAPQDWTPRALREADVRTGRLLTDGRGYLADSTHLRRRDRIGHVRAAHAAGLPAVALLLPALPLEELARRNARRDDDTRVPDDVLRRHASRRSLLDAALLQGEGFDEVLDADPGAQWGLAGG